jgi:hypothetical protein
VSPHVIAEHLADLNYEISRRIGDNSVGPRCVVAWRHKTGGGGHEFYTGTARDASSPSLPTIARGIDVNALVDLAMPNVIKMFEAMRAGESPVEENKDEINARLARVPDKPDESLRYRLFLTVGKASYSASFPREPWVPAEKPKLSSIDAPSTTETPSDFRNGHIPSVPGLNKNARFGSRFAVGTSIAGRPPHRSGRARFEHPAPTSGV